MLKRMFVAAAASALALGGMVVATPAHADSGPQGVVEVAAPAPAARPMEEKPLSPMGVTLCQGATRCGIDTPIRLGTGDSVWREGLPMTINVTGANGKTISVAAFAVRFTSATEFTAVKISTDAQVTPSGGSLPYALARAQVTINPIPAPYDGSYVIVQPADWNVNYGGVPANSQLGNELEEVEVQSARGRDIGFAEQNFTDYFHRRVDLAIPGQQYSVQLLRGGKWVTIDNRGPATVSNSGTASIQAAVPKDLPTGKYRTRVINVTRNITDLSPDRDYTYFTWTHQATPPKPTDPDFNVYTTPGLWDYNGRRWKTNCEPYSQTERCRTEIWATQILYQNGRFTRVDGWAFNNLTYKAAPRSLYKNNPIGGNGVVGYKGNWTAQDGRKWRVECDSAATGRGGCRSYAVATVAEAAPGGGYRVVQKELFNNIVLFN